MIDHPRAWTCQNVCGLLERCHCSSASRSAFSPRVQCTLHIVYRLAVLAVRSPPPSFRSLPSERRSHSRPIASALVRRLQGDRLLNLVRTMPDCKLRIRGTPPVAHSNLRTHHVLGALPQSITTYMGRTGFQRRCVQLLRAIVCRQGVGESANVFHCGLGILQE